MFEIVQLGKKYSHTTYQKKLEKTYAFKPEETCGYEMVFWSETIIEVKLIDLTLDFIITGNYIGSTKNTL